MMKKASLYLCLILFIIGCKESKEEKRINLFLEHWLRVGFDAKKDFCQSEFIDENTFCDFEGNFDFNGALDLYLDNYKVDKMRRGWVRIPESDEAYEHISVLIIPKQKGGKNISWLKISFAIKDEKLILEGIDYFLPGPFIEE